MQPFTTLVATAAPLETMNVDTDQILPARFLKSPRAGGYGQFLFRDLRLREDGSERPEFVLNRLAYRDANTLVANANFSYGSSREGAVYALLDYGFRCVVVPSFNDIFYTNSLRNGLLPVRLPAEDAAMLRRLVTEAANTLLSIDLAASQPKPTRRAAPAENIWKPIHSTDHWRASETAMAHANGDR